MLDTTAYLLTATHPRLNKHFNQMLNRSDDQAVKFEDFKASQAGFMRPTILKLWEVAANELEFQHRVEMLKAEHKALSEKMKSVDTEALSEHEMTSPDGYAAIETKVSTINKMLNNELKTELADIQATCAQVSERIFQSYQELHQKAIQALEDGVEAYFAKYHPNYKLQDEHKAPLHFVHIDQVKDLCETLQLKEKDCPVKFKKAAEKPDAFAKLLVFLCVCNALNHIEVK